MVEGCRGLAPGMHGTSRTQVLSAHRSVCHDIPEMKGSFSRATKVQTGRASGFTVVKTG